MIHDMRSAQEEQPSGNHYSCINCEEDLGDTVLFRRTQKENTYLLSLALRYVRLTSCLRCFRYSNEAERPTDVADRIPELLISGLLLEACVSEFSEEPMATFQYPT